MNVKVGLASHAKKKKKEISQSFSVSFGGLKYPRCIILRVRKKQKKGGERGRINFSVSVKRYGNSQARSKPKPRALTTFLHRAIATRVEKNHTERGGCETTLKRKKEGRENGITLIRRALKLVGKTHEKLGYLRPFKKKKKIFTSIS